MQRVGDLIFRGIQKTKVVAVEQPKRELATWNACLRSKQPEKGKSPAMVVDKETGLQIMNDVDFSGKNHFLLMDTDFKSDIYYKIYGSFTTKQTPFNTKQPYEISDFTLEGDLKKQFMHLYDTPRLIKKTSVVIDQLATMNLSHKEYVDFFKKIKT